MVQNLVGQAIAITTPPVYSSAFPDRNIRTDTVYAAAGNAIATIDTLATITRTYYDALGRPTVVVENLTGQEVENPVPPAFDPAFPDRNVRSETQYDGSGQVIAMIDPAGMISRTYCDRLSRPTDMVENLVGQTIETATPPAFDPAFPDRNIRRRAAYDGTGNRISATDPNGVVTKFELDALGRLRAVVENYCPGVQSDAETNVRTEYAYDGLGNRTGITDGRGKVITFTYDALGRPLTERDPLGVNTELRRRGR